MIRTVIFDFDGTIADSLEAALKLYNEVAPRHGLKTIHTSEIEDLKNFGAKELIKKFQVSPWKLLTLSKEVRSKLKNSANDIPMVKGMDKLLSDLKKNDIKIGIVTSNSKKNVEIFLKKWRLTNIDFVYSAKNIFGKGRVLDQVVKYQKLKKEECVYVGDEVRDVEASQKAGISVIAVTWGFNSKKRLKEAQPSYLVSKPVEILEKISIAS